MPTVNYELASQGTFDYRYLATLDRLVSEANASGNQERVDHAAVAQALLTALRNDTPAYSVDNGYNTQHFAGLASSGEAEVAIENYRKQAADKIADLLMAASPHVVTVTVAAPSPSTVASGGQTQLSATAQDSHTYDTIGWSWSDGGAGGSFSPSAAVANPTYTAPTNAGTANLTITLSVTATCNGEIPASDTKTTSLTVTPVASRVPIPVLKASPTSTSTVHLTWTENAKSITNFSLERRTDSAGWAVIATLKASARSYTDKKLTSGLTYCYRIRAYQKGVGYSAYSSQVSAMPFALPPAPVLNATAVSKSGISLTWTDASDLETSFVLERKTSRSGWKLLKNLPANTTSYLDRGLKAGTTYSYRILAKRAKVGLSPWSNMASATTLR